MLTRLLGHAIARSTACSHASIRDVSILHACLYHLLPVPPLVYLHAKLPVQSPGELPAQQQTQLPVHDLPQLQASIYSLHALESYNCQPTFLRNYMSIVQPTSTIPVRSACITLRPTACLLHSTTPIFHMPVHLPKQRPARLPAQQHDDLPSQFPPIQCPHADHSVCLSACKFSCSTVIQPAFPSALIMSSVLSIFCLAGSPSCNLSC
jgi:hypothetical protein